jgi:aminoglycoside phosphotransferase (APT) family kinase protein
LLHGDVHPGNIIHRADDDLAVLFDWGNARVGPAGFDLTNCIPSAAQPEWALYWEHVEASTGSPVDETQRSTQFQVGRILTQVQYLPFAIEHGSLARAAEMMDLALADSRVLRAWRG